VRVITASFPARTHLVAGTIPVTYIKMNITTIRCSVKYTSRADNGSQWISGSRVKWVNKSGWVTWVSTCDPLNHDPLTDD